MLYFLCKVIFNKSLYPRTFTYDAGPPNLVKNLVFREGRPLCFACTMKTLISAIAEESRFDIFNEYELFKLNFVLLFTEKDVSPHT